MWANNTRRKDTAAIEREFKQLAAIDSDTLDLLSYFRVQHVVMFSITCKLQYREFLVAIYFGQKIRGWSFMREVSRLCPHIRRTTIQDMINEDLIELSGHKVINKLNHRVQSIRLTKRWFNRIETAMKEARETIRKEQKTIVRSTPDSSTPDTFLNDFIES